MHPFSHDNGSVACATLMEIYYMLGYRFAQTLTNDFTDCQEVTEKLHSYLEVTFAHYQALTQWEFLKKYLAAINSSLYIPL